MGWGAGIDLHKTVGKLPAPKKGWTLPYHNYTGPYNPLEKQLKYDPENGEIWKFVKNQQAQRIALQCNTTSTILCMFPKRTKKMQACGRS